LPVTARANTGGGGDGAGDLAVSERAGGAGGSGYCSISWWQ
jgi:hypothetical protein